MRTTVGGRSAAGRVGVVHLLVFFFTALVVVFAGLFRFVLVPSYNEERSGEFRSLLARADAVLPNRERASEAASFVDKAAALVRSGSFGVESELSLLKRWRSLAKAAPEAYAASYFKASLSSTDRFPHADQLAAVVVDASLFFQDKISFSAMREHFPRLDAASFGALKTIAYARSGETSAPSSALSSDAFLVASSAYRNETSDLLAVDAVLAALYAGDSFGARVVIRDRFSRVDGLSPTSIRFLAEMAYDFGDKREAESLFSRLPGPDNALRRADAAFLSGDLKTAREAWLQATEGEAVKYSLYNLALTTSSDLPQALSYARRLRSAVPDFAPGIVLFSRLADPESGRSVLASAAASIGDVLVDLELTRVEAPFDGVDRTQARLWLLQNEAPRSESIARWAAWYAASNGRSSEAMRFVRGYAKEGGNAAWIDFYEGLEAARAGRIEEAEKAFERAASESGDWRLAANTAVLYEVRRSHREALRRYEIAASFRSDKTDAAELQLRISRLLRVLGRDTEARRALEHALIQDPGNRRARAELKRFDGR